MVQIDVVKKNDYFDKIHIRNTTPDDVGQCIDLLLSEFNNTDKRKIEHASRIVTGDCLVAEQDGTIMAVAMVNEHSEYYDGAEIDYVVTGEKYRHVGIMSMMFSAIIDAIPDSDIYILCWHTIGDIHLRHAIDSHDFVLVEKNAKIYDTLYMGKTSCCHCPHYEPICRCGSDLYYRAKHKG